MFKVLFITALKSLCNRRGAALLTIMSIALSVTLLLGIERIRHSARASFESTISGVDLIVGARGGSINLLLYSVFRIGNATNNISHLTYSEIINHEDVEWAIPISLGDSHKGFKVVGTNEKYFEYYKYSGSKNLELQTGVWNKELFDVVIGSKIAKALGYKIGNKIILSHGSDEVSFQEHEDSPFTVVGVLKTTGTSVDGSLHISLKAMTALHINWNDGAFNPDSEHSHTDDVEESAVTAIFLKLKSKIQIFNFQRHINEYRSEPLTAIMPGVSLSELWQTLGMAENVLMVVSAMIFIVSMFAMLIALLSSLNERRREMSILRSVGASRFFIFSLLVVESWFLVCSGVIVGLLFLYGGLLLGRSVLEQELGLSLQLFKPAPTELFYLVVIFIGAALTSIIPAWQAYKNSLADGLSIKI